MAFDQTTRGRLQKFVNASRELLSEELTRQLQATYGLDPKTGTVADLSELKHLDNRERQTAQLLREILKHYIAATPGKNAKEQTLQALDRLVREQAFTVLNRMAALRMMEARGVLVETVAKGYDSQGFKLYRQLAATSQGETGDAYRNYLFSLFDEFSVDLELLFDRHGAQGRLFPRESALLELLEQINHPEIEHLWAEDETIGWIYQYFNSQEERKKMRKESQAPRNSRELAVRNQFFTPRYVVEFLVDNTLGRIWFDATQGNTSLYDRCQYLLVKPEELEAKRAEPTPRTLRDPRTLKLLDPACGSMHFGLYAFDLFLEIYREAWTWEQQQGPGSLDVSTQPDAGFQPLSQTYADEAAYLRDVPRLIIEHNIYGVDIDPRAAQIATLALWLRAQRAWYEAGVKAPQRPIIGQGHVIAAIAPPAEKELRQQFAEQLDTQDAELFEKTLQLLHKLPELGLLLKVEQELPKLIKQVYGGKGEGLFSAQEQETWQQAEQRLRQALSTFTEQVSSSYQSRLFALDALQGLRLIDLTREAFDVVVMNPPFGEIAASSKPYLKKVYGDKSVELYCAFSMRALELMRTSGLLGCITSSSFVLYTDFAGYRDMLLKQQCLEQLANLGESVLDGAYVYTASYTVRKAPPPSEIVFYDLRFEKEKELALKELVVKKCGDRIRFLSPARFEILASSPLCHWASDTLFSLAENAPPLKKYIDDAGVGAAPQADFFNLWWEVSPHKIGKSEKWVRISNGGAFSPYHRPDYLVVDWENDGRRAIADLNNRYPYLNGNVGIRIQRTQLFGKPGITYGKRTDRFNAQILPADQIFTFEGIGVFPKGDDPDYMLGLLAYLNSKFTAYFLNLTAGLHKNDVYIQRLPCPMDGEDFIALGKFIRNKLPLIVKALSIEEVHPLFTGSFLNCQSITSVHKMAVEFKKSDRIDECEFIEATSFIDQEINKKCGLDDEILREIEHDQGYDLTNFGAVEISSATPERERPGFCRSEFEKTSDLFRHCIENKVSPKGAMAKLNDEEYLEKETLQWFANSMISYAVGVMFGRWDIEFVKGDKKSSIPTDPFDALPYCSPGMLLNNLGLPARNEDIPLEYPIRIPNNGIVVDDKGHNWDIDCCIRSAFEACWGEYAQSFETELCEILNFKSIRDYFFKTSGFFKNHLERYSRSRRKAPIYWPLSTVSGGYTLWFYYPRLTNQTLFTAVNDFVEPKLNSVHNDLNGLRKKGAGRSKQEEKELEKLEDLEQELADLRDTLLENASHFRPSQDDGVQISAAPLWSLFRHKPWQKVLKDTWKQLEKGDYDWAHLALNYWPDRVLRKCHEDRSLAIAHDVEERFWEEVEVPVIRRGKDTGETKLEWQPKDLSEAQLQALINQVRQERSL